MITIDISVNNRHYTGTRRVRKRTINLSKIDRINSVSRDVSNNLLTTREALKRVNEIDASISGNKFNIMVFSGLAAGMFSLILGGGTFEFIIATLCCAVVQSIALFSRKTAMFYFLISFIGGLVPALISTIASSYFQAGNAETTAIAAMLPLFPGVAMVNAIRDTMNGDLVSGVARGSEALLTAVGLAVGAMIGFAVKVVL